MNKTIKKILIILLIEIIFTCIYLLTFKINFIKIFFYKGIINLIIISIIFIVLLLIFKKYKNYFDIKDIIIIILLFFLTNIFIFGMIPTTIDRSISVFMLNSISKEELSKNDIENIFIDKYVYKNKAFEKRINEQIATGTIKKNIKGKYTLTKKGRLFLKLFKIFNKMYNINSKLLK